MNRQTPPAAVSQRPAVLIEALEPRIAPAGLLNESKFTSVAVGGTLLLDASGAPGTYQGLTTGSGGGSGSYLLYLTSGRALVYTTDLNGNGVLDPGEITGISLGKDSLGHDPALIIFSNINGDIVTNLQGTSGSTLTDSDHNANNGRDGQLLTDTNIASITLRTLTAADIDPTLPGNTVAARLALTGFSINGNIIAGGNINGVTIDTSGISQLTTKFNGSQGDQLFTGAIPTIDGIYTGTAANNLAFHFTQNNPFSTPQVEGILQPFHAPAQEHGGDILNVAGSSASTIFSIGVLATGDGGANARGGNLSDISMHGAVGGYELIAGNGGQGASGGQGGSILGFNDFGTVTGEALLHTGDGGTGLLGTGGAGGIATFATTNIAATVNVIMGRGGDGFTGGGNGASFTSADFVTPETAIPIGSKFIGTWHNLGDVGSTHPIIAADGTLSYAPEAINFNGIFDPGVTGTPDNFGDGIFTTNSNPDQVVVVFGDGAGGLIDAAGNFNGAANATVNLKVPGITHPVVTVGDFNGDGRPDIAVASGDPHSFNGIYVFLNQIGTTLDPINSSNFTHSIVGDHPFSAAMQTALPTLADQGFYQTSGAVTALAAGDYNGDGITDIAYVQVVTVENTTFPQRQIVGVLLGDPVFNAATGKPLLNTQSGKLVGSGYFYANTAASKAAPSLLDDGPLPTNAINFLQATSTTAGNVPNPTTGLPTSSEIFIYAGQGDNHFRQYAVQAGLAPGSLALAGANVGLGQVDTNRALGITNISLVDANLEQFTLQDVNDDGNADVVVLTKTPANFLITFKGAGLAGTETIASNPNALSDNSGIFLGVNTTGIALTSLALDTTGVYDGVGVLFESGNGPGIAEDLLRTTAGAPSFYANAGSQIAGRTVAVPTPLQDLSVETIDTFYVTVPTLPTPANGFTSANLHPDTGYGVLLPESSSFMYTDLAIFTGPDLAPGGTPGTLLVSDLRYETANGYFVRGGNGGNSTAGVGGSGGVIGGTTSSLGSGMGALTVIFPISNTYAGQVFLQGGNGGNGTNGGGIGGDITGIAVSYAPGNDGQTSDVELAAGNGGNGIGGDGGRGGNLSLLSIESGSFFSAGNAGNGLHGGQGGSITGNGAGVFDTATATVQLITGIGGEGALAGGAGGNISGWDTQFIDFIGSGNAGGSSLSYTTGAGGGAAGGDGGNGGSILNSSPDQSQNNLSGPLTLLTGAGGNGLAGGNGGAINTFINHGTNQSAVPTELTVITGNGGIGVSTVGGTGGAITNFTSNATGLANLVTEDFFGIGRVIAGDGGASFGGTGGIGGTLTHVVATATSTPLVVAAGAGGDGLTIGGAGGAVLDSTINSAALQIGKMLVVGGKGGNATAAQPTDIFLPGDLDTTDLAHTILAFGNARGQAGNGGDISNVTQPVGAQTAVDLIAGNGGSTPNASTALTPNSGVGTGGSVTGVTLTGTVGAISRDTTLGAITNPPIQAYALTDQNGATTTLPISTIIDLLADPNSTIGSFNDTAGPSTLFGMSTISGNVGIIAGAAGTVRNAQPAVNGVNGDVTNITAGSFMSIVAGSVTNVAPVRVLAGLTVTNSDGVLGADKSPTTPFTPNGQLDYFTSSTASTPVTNLQPGYSLVGTAADGTALSGDGAIFASTIQQTVGTQIRGPRVFPVMT